MTERMTPEIKLYCRKPQIVQAFQWFEKMGEVEGYIHRDYGREVMAPHGDLSTRRYRLITIPFHLPLLQRRMGSDH